MNRVKYKFHPSEYELGENEKFHSDMEAKGWRQVNRGANLSKFTPVEPSRIRYRIEVSSSGFLEEAGLSEGQLAVFEDCGWEYVTNHGFLHIFRAPEGSEAPEFYTDPAQQAQTLNKARRDLLFTLGIAIIMAIIVCLPLPFGIPSQFFREKFKRFIQMPTLYIWYGFILLWSVYQTAWSAWKINRTYTRLKKGEPLDHAPKGNRTIRKLLNYSVLFVTGICLVLLVSQFIGTRSEKLPGTAGGPYLLADDLGWEGARTDFMGRSSKVTYTPSLLADYWDTVEYISTPEGETAWMYQDVYRLRFPGMADALAQALMDTAVFGGEFVPMEVDGLDAAWTTGLFEVVAIKENIVAYVDGLGAADGDFDPQAVCAALKAKWGD